MEPRNPKPDIDYPGEHSAPGDDDTLDLSRKETHRAMQKNEVVEFLRKELTEERTDQVIEILAKHASKRIKIPGLGMKIATHILDWLLPEKLIDALEEAL